MRDLRRPGGQAGQSLVELAVGSLVLVLLLIGAGELGRAFYFAVSIQGATREAARSAAWFSPGDFYRPNPDLSDGAILASVDASLAGSGLTAVMRPQASCLTGTGPHNGPRYADSAYPDTTNLAWVYACYQKPNGGGQVGTLAAPDPAFKGGEVQVTILLDYGMATGFFRDQMVTPGVHLAATTHMRIEGSS